MVNCSKNCAISKKEHNVCVCVCMWLSERCVHHCSNAKKCLVYVQQSSRKRVGCKYDVETAIEKNDWFTY